MGSARIIAGVGEEIQRSAAQAAQLQLARVTERVLMSSTTVKGKTPKFNQKIDTRVDTEPLCPARTGRGLSWAVKKMERQKF